MANVFSVSDVFPVDGERVHYETSMQTVEPQCRQSPSMAGPSFAKLFQRCVSASQRAGNNNADQVLQ